MINEDIPLMNIVNLVTQQTELNIKLKFFKNKLRHLKMLGIEIENTPENKQFMYHSIRLERIELELIKRRLTV